MTQFRQSSLAMLNSTTKGGIIYENYKENLANLPEDYKEVIIDGGCHAYFGMYGNQEGDGTPTITNEEQIKITAKEIIEFLN